MSGVESPLLPENVTASLRALRSNQPEAVDQVIAFVYQQLHMIATNHLRGERKGHTLRPTALVHEAYLRLAASDAGYQNRAHFLAIASITMRQILVDYARRATSQKRQAGYQAQAYDVSIDNVATVSGVDPENMLALDEALTRLSRQDDRKGRLLELVYFGGLTQQEAAVVLAVSVETVYRDMKIAKAWLRNELRSYREVDFQS